MEKNNYSEAPAKLKLLGLQHRGHSKSPLVVQQGWRGGGGSLKSELKRTGRGGVKPICTFAL